MFLSCTSKTKYNHTTLDLGNKGLKQLPDSILRMHNLKVLNLGNAFTLYPPLSALGSDSRPLGKDDNRIAYLPQEFTRLEELTSLYIYANRLKDLPTGFHRLAKLDTLDISFNEHLELSSIMDELEKMRSLQYLNIIGISASPSLIEDLKRSLPNTRVVTKFDELEFETDRAD